MEQAIETAVAVRAADVYKDFTHYTAVGSTGDFKFIPSRRTEKTWILGEKSKPFKTLRAAIAAAQETGLKSTYNLGWEGGRGTLLRIFALPSKFNPSTKAECRV